MARLRAARGGGVLSARIACRATSFHCKTTSRLPAALPSTMTGGRAGAASPGSWPIVNPRHKSKGALDMGASARKFRSAGPRGESFSTTINLNKKNAHWHEGNFCAEKARRTISTSYNDYVDFAGKRDARG